MLKLYKQLSKQKPNTKLGVTNRTTEAAKPDNELLLLETDKATDIRARRKVKVQQMCNKHYPPSTREWSNSIYVYNKIALSTIAHATVSSMKLIKSYFNLYNYKLERRIRNDRLLLRLRRLSSHRIFVSDGEFKHTNNKVTITLYLFNRQRVNYNKKIYKSSFTRLSLPNIKKVFLLIKQKGILSLRNANKRKLSVLKVLKSHNKEVLTYTGLSEHVINFYKKFIKKSLTKLKLYIYYNQLIYINKSKFNYTYLQYLKKHLEKIYNKNVEFNLVNIRRFYLNSHIFSEAFTLKIRKNRRKLLRYLNLIKRKVKLHDKKNLYYQPILSYLNQNVYVNGTYLNKAVLNNIKYKHITGFRLEANGRLTRRYTASKSVSKLRYKGNLLNIDSSYRGISSVLLKGNLKPNLQYSKLESKTRIGSFGIKGSISSN